MSIIIIIIIIINDCFPGGEGQVSRPPSVESAHSNASLMHRAMQDMPYAVDRIWQLRSVGWQGVYAVHRLDVLGQFTAAWTAF